MAHKLTDEEIIAVLKVKSEANDDFCELVFDLVSRLQAELEKKSAALGALLCHATGGKLSKDTYPMGVMGRAVTNYIKDCCTDAENTAVKELAEKVKEYFNPDSSYDFRVWIDNLVKERIGEDNA